jgi:uncharacterized protein YutE (UPF0331/DUF86 family)
MSPGLLDPAVIADRASWIRSMVAGMRALPLDDFPSFASDRHQVAAAESYLRRAIEALVDLGRNVPGDLRVSQPARPLLPPRLR